MTIDSTKDILYLVLSLATGWIAVFLCWTLYEVAKMLHQTNAIITDAREKISRVEKAILSIKEKFDSSVGYLSAMAEGGKSLLSFLHTKEEKKEQRRKSKKTKDDVEEED